MEGFVGKISSTTTRCHFTEIAQCRYWTQFSGVHPVVSGPPLAHARSQTSCGSDSVSLNPQGVAPGVASPSYIYNSDRLFEGGEYKGNDVRFEK